MALQEFVRRVLELAERCTLESEIPRELKEAVRWCIAKDMAEIQPVLFVGWRDPKQRYYRNEKEVQVHGQLFSDAPLVILATGKLQGSPRARLRLLLRDAGEAALAEMRMADGDAPKGKSVQPPSTASAGTTHSDDFRCVRWHGAEYTFTAMQAACVRVLWEAWERGAPVLGQASILESAESASSKLRDVFYKGRHPAWNRLIVPSNKGAFRLAERP